MNRRGFIAGLLSALCSRHWRGKNPAFARIAPTDTKKCISLRDGDWNDPATWDNDVPTEGSVVNINHAVTVIGSTMDAEDNGE